MVNGEWGRRSVSCTYSAGGCHIEHAHLEEKVFGSLLVIVKCGSIDEGVQNGK